MSGRPRKRKDGQSNDNVGSTHGKSKTTPLKKVANPFAGAGSSRVPAASQQSLRTPVNEHPGHRALAPSEARRRQTRQAAGSQEVADSQAEIDDTSETEMGRPRDAEDDDEEEYSDSFWQEAGQLPEVENNIELDDDEKDARQNALNEEDADNEGSDTEEGSAEEAQMELVPRDHEMEDDDEATEPDAEDMEVGHAAQATNDEEGTEPDLGDTPDSPERPAPAALSQPEDSTEDIHYVRAPAGSADGGVRSKRASPAVMDQSDDEMSDLERPAQYFARKKAEERKAQAGLSGTSPPPPQPSPPPAMPPSTQVPPTGTMGPPQPRRPKRHAAAAAAAAAAAGAQAEATVDEDGMRRPTLQDLELEDALNRLRLESCLGTGLLPIVHKNLAYPDCNVVLVILHGNRNLTRENQERFEELIRTGQFMPRSPEFAIVCIVDDNIIDPSSLTLDMSKALKTVVLLDGASGEVTQCNGNHRRDAQNKRFRIQFNIDHIPEEDVKWTPEMYKAARDPNGFGVCAATFYRRSVLDASPYGNEFKHNLVTNNKMGVFRDLPNRQLYLLMLRIALAKTPEDVNKVYGEATSNSYSAKVKIITTSLQQAREMLPDLAVRRPYSRDEATMSLSFDADAYATLGGGFLTPISTYWLCNKALEYAAMHTAFTVTNVLDREVGDQEVARFFARLDLNWQDMRELRFLPDEVLVGEVIATVAEEVFLTLPPGMFLDQVLHGLFDGDKPVDEVSAEWLSCMRKAYKELHTRLKAALAVLSGKRDLSKGTSGSRGLQLATLPDFFYALSLLDSEATPVTALKWTVRLPVFCPSALHVLVKELSRGHWAQISKNYMTLRNVRYCAVRNLLRVKTPFVSVHHVLILRGVHLVRALREISQAMACFMAREILSFVMPGLYSQKLRPGTTSDKIITLQTPFDTLRSWVINNAHALGYSGPVAHLPLALDTAIMTIISFILETGPAYLLKDKLSQDLQGLTSYQTDNIDTLGVTAVLVSILDRHWSSWSDLRERAPSKAIASENRIPEDTAEAVLMVKKQTRAYLSSPDADKMVYTCVRMLRMWPYGILSRAAALPTYKAAHQAYKGTVAAAAVDAYIAAPYNRVFLEQPAHEPIANILTTICSAIADALDMEQEIVPFCNWEAFEPSAELRSECKNFATRATRVNQSLWVCDWLQSLDPAFVAAAMAATADAADTSTGTGRASPAGSGAAAASSSGAAQGHVGSGQAGPSTVTAKVAPALPAQISLPRADPQLHPVFAETKKAFAGNVAQMFTALDESALLKVQMSRDLLGEYVKALFRSKMKALPLQDARGMQTIPPDLLDALRVVHSIFTKYIAYFHGGQTPAERETAHQLLLDAAFLPGVAATLEEMKLFFDGVAAAKGKSAGLQVEHMQPKATQTIRKIGKTAGASSKKSSAAHESDDAGSRASSGTRTSKKAAKGAGAPDTSSAESSSHELHDLSDAANANPRDLVERGRQPRVLSSGPPVLRNPGKPHPKPTKRKTPKSDELVRDNSSQERDPSMGHLPQITSPIMIPGTRHNLPRSAWHNKGFATTGQGSGTSNAQSAAGPSGSRSPALSRAPSTDASSGGSRASSSKRRDRSLSDDGSPSGEKDEPAKKKAKGKKKAK